MPQWRRISCVPVLLAALSAGMAAVAQSAAPAAGSATKLPVYDIVSIKPDKTGSGHVSIHTDDGNLTATNVSLLTLIELAYGYKRDQVVGLEGPLASAAFDIRAKVVDPDLKVLLNLKRGEREQMLRPILEQRFHLKFHTEMRTLPVYELVQAKGGSKLAQTSAVDVSEGDGKTFHGVSSGSESMHTTRISAEIIAHDVPLTVLTSDLSESLRRVVVDHTGLPGKYDVWLRWTPEQAVTMDKSADNGTTVDALPDLYTAIQEQLGLKLQGAKAPIEVLVIDSVAMPDED